MKLKRTIRKTFTNVIEHDVPKSAAALTYNLLFALFPLLIFISNLLGLLDLNVASITEALLPIMPDDVVYLLESYLNHITNNSSKVLFWFSLVFTVWFPMRAVKGLMDDVRLAYGLGKPAKPVFYTIRQLLFTIVFFGNYYSAVFAGYFGKTVCNDGYGMVGCQPDFADPTDPIEPMAVSSLCTVSSHYVCSCRLAVCSGTGQEKPGQNDSTRCRAGDGGLAYGEHWLFHICRKRCGLFRHLRYIGCGDRATGLALSDFFCSDPWGGVQCGIIACQRKQFTLS